MSAHPSGATDLVRIALFGGFLLISAAPAVAASVDEHPRFGPVLFGLAVLVAAAKAGGLLAERVGQPSVLGELLVGILVGNLLPPLFGAGPIAFVRSEPTLGVLAEVGVLILLFDVGLEADLRALGACGRGLAPGGRDRGGGPDRAGVGRGPVAPAGPLTPGPPVHRRDAVGH